MRVILSRTEKTNLYLSFKVAASQEVSSTFEIFENSQYFLLHFFSPHQIRNEQRMSSISCEDQALVSVFCTYTYT